VFRIRRYPQHLGIIADYLGNPRRNSLIHTWTSTGRVVEHLIDEDWQDRIVRAFAFPGLENVPWPPLS
jgi:hypothetical protein